MRTRKQALKYLEKNWNVKDFTAPIDTHFKTWQDELKEEIEGQETQVKNIVRICLGSDRIYTIGLGRSRLAVMDSGMRGMHGGYQLFEVGHPYTPAMGTDKNYKDLLLAVSGSGETRYVVTTAEKAKENNVPIIAVTSNAKSKLAKLATEKIVTKGKKIYPKDSLVPPEEKEPINFLQTKSETKARYFGELLNNCIAKMKGIREEDYQKRHANTE